MLNRLQIQIRRLFRKTPPAIWYHPDYRLPVTGLQHVIKIEPRRADYVMWCLASYGALRGSEIHRPRRIRFMDLARVHTQRFLSSLPDPDVLSHAFGVEAWDIPVEQVLRTVRLGCGGTLEATRFALKRGGPTMNLLGGFHHAYPDKAVGLCLLNDLAVALKVVRQEGFTGPVAIVDLDAHPPDGTAACLDDEKDVWIGSLSGSDWGPMDRVDNTILPEHCGDRKYLEALDGLLHRMPKAELVFVVSGGDVLADDFLGQLGLSLEGARMRDRMVAEKLGSLPAVWVPGGGYHDHAWRVLTGAALTVFFGYNAPIPPNYQPLRAQFQRIAKSIDPEKLGVEPDALLTEEDLEEVFGVTPRKCPRLLGYYTADGFEYALYRYGFLKQVRRLGYRRLKVEIDRTKTGDRVRLFGDLEEERHVLMECVLSRQQTPHGEMLFINWLTLRHPRGRFTRLRPKLPGQETPGLGLALEAGEMLLVMAKRLGLNGIVFRPAWYHVAYLTRRLFRFLDPKRQGRFEAMLRDLGDKPLLDVTLAAAEERVTMNGEPYLWEAADWAYHLEAPESQDEELIGLERDQVSFAMTE